MTEPIFQSTLLERAYGALRALVAYLPPIPLGEAGSDDVINATQVIEDFEAGAWRQPLKVTVPTYLAAAKDYDPAKTPEWSEPNTEVLIQYCEGVRLLLGTHDADFPCQDIQIERRLGGWSIFLHPVPGSDPSGFVYFLDNGKSYAQQETCFKEDRLRWLTTEEDVPRELNLKQSHWDIDPDYPLEDWQREVAQDDTRQSYTEWCAAQRQQKAEDG